MSVGQVLLVTGVLLTVGLGAALLAGRVRVPGLLLFLGVGMLVGSDGTGWFAFSDYELARNIGVVALALILYEGGLTAGWPEIRLVLRPALSLAIVATLITAAIAGLLATWLFDLSLLEGLLVGSLLSSTDGAAIFAILRGSTLKRRLARTLEGEAGFNDPVAVLLVLGFVEWIEHPGYGVADMLVLFVRQLGIGAVVGLAVGRLSVLALSNVRLSSAGLYPVASIAAGALAFGAADVVEGSGFLAIYLVGLAIGGTSSPAKRTVVTFHEGLAWVAQLGMFFTLGLLVFPSDLPAVALQGTLLALFAAVLARPIAIFIATPRMGFTSKDKLVLGWAGLRGAVPVVLATFPVLAGVPEAERFFNIVFFAVLVSTALQGTTFETLARRLGSTTNESAVPMPLAGSGTMRSMGAEVVEYPVAHDDAVVGARVRELGLPRDALLNVIARGEQAIPPRGSTVIESGDRLHVLVRQEVAVEFRILLDRWRVGPIGPPPRPPRLPRSSPSIFTSRPWREPDGDAGNPALVNGLFVVQQVRTRRDVPGALVELADGRYAITGPILFLGGPVQLVRAAQRRLGLAEGDAEASWWREVIGALAARS